MIADYLTRAAGRGRRDSLAPGRSVGAAHRITSEGRPQNQWLGPATESPVGLPTESLVGAGDRITGGGPRQNHE